MIADKIKTKKEIEQIVIKLRKENPTCKIVTTNGAFDVMHAGHLRSLEQAKSMGDCLIVGLNSDQSIKRYKSKDRPVIPEKDRATMLAGMGVVDFVVVFEEDDPRDLLEHIKTDIHVKSKTGYKGIEKDAVEKNGGKIVLVDDIPGISTTEIIKKIKNLPEK